MTSARCRCGGLGIPTNAFSRLGDGQLWVHRGLMRTPILLVRGFVKSRDLQTFSTKFDDKCRTVHQGQKMVPKLSLREGVKKYGIFLEYFLNRWTPPTPLGARFAKKSGFQGRKQWPPKFHIKFRNPGPLPPLYRKYS